MSQQHAPHVSALGSDLFVDPAGRKMPVRHQADVNAAVRELSSRPALFASTTQAERRRLVELARSQGLKLPLSFASEAVQYRIDRKDIPYGQTPMDPTSAPLHALTNEGRSALAKYGLDPDLDGPPAGSAMFGGDGAGEPEISQDERDRLLSMTESGKAILRRRGMSPAELYALTQSNPT